jgi:hypothetical protein
MFSWLTVKHQKAGEDGAVKGTWNKWAVRKRPSAFMPRKSLYWPGFGGYLCGTDDRLNHSPGAPGKHWGKPDNGQLCCLT